jgi:hypothetical protein
LTAVRVNGVGTGLTAAGYQAFTTLILDGPFRMGVNNIDFVVLNAGITPNPSGIRVVFEFATAPVLSALPEWRATLEQRQSWQNTLNARVEQDMEVAAALSCAADQTEQLTLSSLRDALVQAGTLGGSIPTLSSTGVRRALVFLPPGQGLLVAQTDTAWTITSSPGGGPTSRPFVALPDPVWLPNDARSSWVAPRMDERGGGDAVGDYTYQTRFDLSGFDPALVNIELNIAVDDAVVDIRLNGHSQGPVAIGFNAFAQHVVGPADLVPGINTLEIVIHNAGVNANPSGLRVDIVSNVLVPVTPDWLTDTLLIDVDVTTSQKITRLAEATTMMQTLLFALRNDSISLLQPRPPVSSWQLVEDPGSFDLEWGWMGTDDDWHGIMRVFLYPENLLLPMTRLAAIPESGAPAAISERTAVFADFMNEMDSNAPVTPQQALLIAQDYITALGAARANYNPLVLPNDLLTLRYPDPGNLNFNTQPWGFAAADWQTPTNVPFLWEAGFFVPVHVALELQKAGHFEAALDWFKLVYRFDLPLVQGSDMNRRQFYGLHIESVGLAQFTYAQIPRWLLDSTNPHQIAPTRLFPYTRFTILSIVSCLISFGDQLFGAETESSMAQARLVYLQAQTLLGEMSDVLPIDSTTQANPVLSALQQTAEVRLFNLRSGRNIAGLQMPPQIDTAGAAAVSIQPSAYRYSALIERAKQQVALALQVEASYLASLEKQDNEQYNHLRAQDDLETADATVTLQALQLKTAQDGVALARDQANKASDGVNHYDALISSDIVSQEQAAIDFQWASVGLQVVAGGLLAASAVQSAASVSTLFNSGSGAVQALAQSLSTFAGAASSTSAVLNMQASLEEKQMDWQFGLSQAQNDLAIAQQQISIANDQQAGAQQQLTISQLQSAHAKATVNFLATKFTNADLYRWMSGVLGGVYAFFLQQATSTARVAQAQLAFMRQLPTPSVIRPSYCQPLPGANAPSQGAQGLTGAESLLEDIAAIDQYAIDTDLIRLQPTKQISLALLDPYAFQQFISTGVLRFSTPMSLFDQGRPGNYLRLITQVRVSMQALIPPGLGICATLANSGISRVIVRDQFGNFSPVLVCRDPQQIAVSSPSSSTGLFALSATTQQALLQPFEDLGVDTQWEFRLPKAANPFDYSTIADIQVEIDYTALDSPDYRLAVQKQMGSSLSADRAYSFAQQFPDAWYALNNAGQTANPFNVQVQTVLEDFPPNLKDLAVAQVLLWLIPADGQSFQLRPTLQFTPSDSGTAVGGAVGALGGGAPPTFVFSTRRGNAAPWIPIIGSGVEGSWTLAFPNTPDTAAVFDNEQIQDILMVVTYSGQVPAWPS